MLNKFPEKLYVKIENEGTDDECFLAEKRENVGEFHETITVGVYKFVEMVKAVNQTGLTATDI